MSSRFGLRFQENMYGTHRPVEGGGAERPFVFRLQASSGDLKRTLLGDGHVEITGHVEAEGFATRAPLQGFMIIKPLVARTIRYEFDFVADDGRACHFAGEKTIRHLHPIRTWTTLPGAVFSGGREIALVRSHFDVRELGAFLFGFRLTGRRRTATAPAQA